MKILYILHSTDPVAGATKSFLTLLNGIVQKGVSPVVVLPDSDGIYKQILEMGINAYVLPLKRNCYPRFKTWHQKKNYLPVLVSRIVNSCRIAKKIETIIQTEKIDIVHTNSSIISSGLYAAKSLKVPHLCHFREYGDKDFSMYYIPLRRCYRWLMSRKGCYTACITKDILNYHGFSGNPRSRVIYNGIASATTNNDLSSLVNGKFILFAGRVEPAKGVDQLVEAYIAYRKQKNDGSPLPLLIAGEEDAPAYSVRLKQMLDDAGLTDKDVKFLGARKDIDNLMQQAQVVVVPSRYEAFGRCMPEAMFNKCLVIGKNTGGTKEQLDNGLNLQGQEIALRYDTTEELTQRLVEVTSHDKSFYDKMIQRAYDTVISLYSNESYIDNVYNFYQEILKNDKS